MASDRQLIFIELNEINFDAIKFYCERGELPHFGRLLRHVGFHLTTSEEKIEEIEPWVQWVTAHTGKRFAEHKVLRLGDIVHCDVPQIWEELEKLGYKVGAVSPINADNRTKNASFFIPDPWTSTRASASALLKKVHHAICQAVNDNAQNRITFWTALWLFAGFVTNARLSNFRSYFPLLNAMRRKPWARAMLLDALLADIFIRQLRLHRPNFATLFLNAGAHIQHHYMYSSPVYGRFDCNPDWYLPRGEDPVAEVYRLYDRIIGQIRTIFPDSHLMIATGLHQDLYPEPIYYWRLRDHTAFLRKIGVPFLRIEPRMSRDFLITCVNDTDASIAAHILQTTRTKSNIPLFEVDNRGSDIFATLSYPHEITKEFNYLVGNRVFSGFRDDVSFVAIKNGQHNGIGYFIDAGVPKGTHRPEFPLTEIPKIIHATLHG